MESAAAQGDSPGRRLRAYLLERTGGTHGWVNAFAARAGVKRQSLSGWMGDRERPERGSIEAMADALGVRPYEIVAVLDGDGPVLRVDDEALWAMFEDRVERLLDERLGPRPGSTARDAA